jgi:TDG/mug DNA glycosylase family protein
VGHHFARPGNRFWRALADSGFTDRLLAADEEHELLRHGLGVTNVVQRATAAAAELSREELVEGGRELEEKVRRFAPRVLCVLGITAYRSAFARPLAAMGAQPERVGDARVWVLPNPSGLNAHYAPADFARLFREVREAARRRP